MIMFLSDGGERVRKHTHTHAHTRALWSRHAQTTGTHVEQVSEQTFIPTLSCSMSTSLECFMSIFFTHLVLYAVPALWPWNAMKIQWPCVLLRCFCLVCIATLLPGGFCLSAPWPHHELTSWSVPSEVHAAHLAPQYLSWLGSWLSAGINGPFPILAQKACPEVHKDL